MSKNKKTVHNFSNFGISSELLKGINQKGYAAPTPIQNKTIPLIMCGRNVVAMAPTGSGKTAAFLIPMFEKLKSHSSTGARALIISPTRELAAQTVKFATELGKFMNLKAAVLLGGESMDNDFKAMHENPDIIIATPARLLHIQVEMGARLNLSNVEYIVFDEGDRLFELGLVEQLTDTLNRLPKSRQTVIFSATLPGNLVDFAKAGLHDPMLIRLDLDKKVSENLKINTLYCSSDAKLTVLLELLLNMFKEKKQVIVFFATKHHIEYVSKILCNYKLDHVMVYSGLDPEYRRINTERFISGECGVMLVTDVAARGIDIPALPYMINYHFPDKPKLFVHRVGRVARAGLTGTALNLIDSHDLPYLMDTFMFLSKPVKIVDDCDMTLAQAEENGLIGSVPSTVMAKHSERLREITKFDCEVKGLQGTSERAYKKYGRLKMMASAASVKRSRAMIAESMSEMRCHPRFAYANDVSETLFQFKAELKAHKPQRTVFETTYGRNEKAITALTHLRQLAVKTEQMKIKNPLFVDRENFRPTMDQKKEIKYIVPSIRRHDVVEHHLQLNNTGFAAEAKEAILELQSDGAQGTARACGAKRQRETWDRKKKKFVTAKDETAAKKIRTESGALIPASYKTDIYQKWLKTSNTGMIAAKTVSFESDDEGGEHGERSRSYNDTKRKTKSKAKPTFQLLNAPGKRSKAQAGRGAEAGERSGGRQRELRPEQVQRKMKEKDKKKDFQKQRQIVNRKKGGNKKRK